MHTDFDFKLVDALVSGDKFIYANDRTLRVVRVDPGAHFEWLRHVITIDTVSGESVELTYMSGERVLVEIDRGA